MSSMTSGKSKQISSQPRRYWTPLEEEALIIALKTLRATGWKCDGGFKGGYLVQLESMLAAKCPTAEIKVKHIKSKIHVWKKDYGHVMGILGCSGGAGVSLDPSTNMIVTESESVWEEYVKVHKEAAKLRGRALPWYNSWVEIFGNDRAQGNEAIDIGDALQDLLYGGGSKSIDERAEFMSSSGTNRVLSADDCFDDAMSNTPPTKNDQPTKSSTSCGKRKRREVGVELISNLMGKFLENTSSALDQLTNKLNDSEKTVSSSTSSEIVDRRKLYDAMSELEDISEEDQLRAVHRLALNSREMDVFWGMPKSIRSKFVKMLLHG